MTGRAQRRLIVLPMRDYPDADEDFRAGMDESVAVVKRYWTSEKLDERAFTAIEPEALLDRDQLTGFLSEQKVFETSEHDALVVYLTAHGHRGRQGAHYLLFSQSGPIDPLRDGLVTAELVARIAATPARHVLILVNACFAGSLESHLRDLLADLPEARRGLETIAVIVSAGFDERPRLREFSTLLEHVDRALRSTAGFTAPELAVVDFVQELQNAATRLGFAMPVKVWPPTQRRTPTACLPNPGYRPRVEVVAPALRQVAARAEELDYWLGRASGRRDATDPGWYFTGRRELTDHINQFLRGADRALIVTGTVGSGKSAVIARAVTLSDPTFLSEPRFADVVASARAADALPPPGSVDVALLSRNKDSRQLLTEIIERLGEELPPIAADVDRVTALREHLERLLDARTRPLTVVLDGLDEASDPIGVVSNVIIPLRRKGSAGVRWVIGVRSPSPSQPVERSDGDRHLEGLLGLVRDGLDVNEELVLRTDGVTVGDDIAGYVEAVLAGSSGWYGRGAGSGRDVSRGAIARVVADRVQPSFLDAQFVAASLSDASEAQELDDPDWLASLDEGTVGHLRRDLVDTADATRRAHEELVAVLRASAFALGAGVPWADIWPTMAGAVLGRSISDADALIAEVTSGRLSGYLVLGEEGGRVVFAPVHQRLADILCREPWRVAPAATVTPRSSGPESENGHGEGAIHARIAQALSGLLAPDAHCGVGLEPHPYLRRHLVPHAARGEVLSDEILAGILPWERSGSVRAALGIPTPAWAAGTALGAWTAIEAHLGDADPSSRALSLAFRQVAESGDSSDPTRLTAVGSHQLAPQWVAWPLTGNVLARVDARLTCVAEFRGVDGRPLLAVGESAGTVRIWEPGTGAQVGDPLRGHIGGVTGVAGFTDSQGHTRLATTSLDGTVRIWDPTTGAQVGDPLTGHIDGVMGVVGFTDSQGRARLATTGDDGTVRIWDPTIGTEIRDPLTGHTGWVTGVVAFIDSQGRNRLATTGRDGTVRVWDPGAGAPVGDPVPGHTDWVTGVAAFTDPQGHTRLATTSWDGTVRIWDPGAGAPVGAPLRGHADLVTGVAAFTDSQGHTRLATTGADMTVRIWDPGTGALVGAPLRGHTREVSGVVAFIDPQGRSRVATTSLDGTVRIWDPTTGAQSGDTFRGHTREVTGVAAFTDSQGRSRVATTSHDETVRIWDPGTGAQVGEFLTGHTDVVTGVVAFIDSQGRTRLATTSADITLRIWDPGTGAQVGDPLRGHADVVMGVVAFTDPHGRARLATTSWDETVRIWDPATGTQIRDTLRGHTGWVTGVVGFIDSHGRTRLATTRDDGTVQIWDPGTGDQDGDLLRGHADVVTGVVAFSDSDGHDRLATTSRDRTVRIWDPGTRTQVGASLRGHTGIVTGVVAFTDAHGHARLATTSEDETVRIWDPEAPGEVQRIVLGSAVTAIGVVPASGDQPALLIIGGTEGRLAALAVVG